MISAPNYVKNFFKDAWNFFRNTQTDVIMCL